MGQRLNLEIITEEKVIASAYYHWSAYTPDTFHHIEKVIEAYNIEKEFKTLNLEDDVSATLQAINLLEATGARIDKDDTEFLNDLYPSRKYEVAVNRSDGLIGITTDTIDTYTKSAEGTAYVVIDEEFFGLDVLNIMTKEEYEEEREEFDDLSAIESLPEWKFSFTIENIPFSEFHRVMEFIVGSTGVSEEGFIYQGDVVRPI